MKILLLGISTFILSFVSLGSQQNFDQFSARFVSGYNALNMPPLALSYVNGLQNIKSADSVQKQVDFFSAINAELPKYNIKELSPSQKVDYTLIKYETGLNLQRLAL